MSLEDFEQAGRSFDQVRRQSHEALGGDEDHELQGLAELSRVDYDRIRKKAAKQFGVQLSVLDKEVSSRRPHRASKSKSPDSKGSGRRLTFPEVEPWPDPVEGDALLCELCATVRRYVSLPEHAAVGVSLWVLWSWGYDGFDIAPRLAVLSPEKRCGKSTLLEILFYLTCRSLLLSGISPSAIFRTIEEAHPTLLMDECDTFVKHSEELRGILNSGHTRASANIIRNVGDPPEPRMFSTWSPMVLAAIGTLPGTVEDRSIIIRMQRKAPGETVTSFPRSGKHAAGLRASFTTLARKIKRWMTDHAPALAETDPAMPDGLHDRAKDNWRPLLAIADVIGGAWPHTAQQTAMALSGTVATGSDSVGVQLLGDIRGLLEATNAPQIGSQALCDELITLEERPWNEWRKGKPISPAQLARLLRPFGVSSRNLRWSTGVLKGYVAEDFNECFARYLPLAPELSLSNRYNATSLSQSGDEPVFQSATHRACSGSENALISAPSAACSAVADQSGDFLENQEDWIEEDHP